MEAIRYIQMCDREFWFRLDRHLPEAEYEKKVRDRQGYVLLKDGRPLGLLRYNLFWDNTPFCTMLYVVSDFQGQGYGRKLMEHWEKDMKTQGYDMVLTSTQADEQAQHFYRKLGYKDCGGFVIDLERQRQPMELFFIKDLTTDSIIFLDIDGVLNSNFWNDSHQREISDGTLIDEEKIKLLACLVKRTGAKIILHSGWRTWFDSELKPLRTQAQRLVELLEKEGMQIDGVTPDLTTEEIRKTKKFSLVKAQEILLWLKSHKDVTKWVVLDDLDLHNAQVGRHQVKPDQRTGLTQTDVEKAVEMLMGHRH